MLRVTEVGRLRILGLLAVRPQRYSGGIEKEDMEAAERYARKNMGVMMIWKGVIWT